MIAPNNELPATHFVEVWIWNNEIESEYSPKPIHISNMYYAFKITKEMDGRTICIFKIRLNKLPTKHKFI